MNLQLLRSNKSSAAAISYLPSLCSFLADMDSEEGFPAMSKSPTLPGNRTPNRWPPATPSPSEMYSDSNSDGQFNDESEESFCFLLYRRVL